MRIRVYPYKQGSRSARALADALGGRVLRLEGSTFRPRRDDFVINWGSSNPTITGFNTRTIDNYGDAPIVCTEVASNKLMSFVCMAAEGVSIPEFWTDADAIPDDAFPIVCRTVLRGHSGAGIRMAETREELVRAPLYVRYVPKQDEYRVHVAFGRVIAVQRKARRTDVADPNWRIRNHANGFNFVRGGVDAPADVLESAMAAVAALGLDFGGVDVIWNQRRSRAYVLEVNTACGLEGQTVEDYAAAFREEIARVQRR